MTLDRRPKVKHRLGAVIVMVSLAGCTRPAAPPPPTTRPPAGVDDVTGIWRTIHRGTLQLRANGTYVLITGVAPPMAGTYRLRGGEVEMTDDACGPTIGTYEMRVAPRARLELAARADGCTVRRERLTLDPWLYAAS